MGMPLMCVYVCVCMCVYVCVCVCVCVCVWGVLKILLFCIRIFKNWDYQYNMVIYKTSNDTFWREAISL